MLSIVSNERRCLVCEMPEDETHLYKHYIYYDDGKAAASKEYGCWCYLCARHITVLHFSERFSRKIKAHTQKQFNEAYPELDFVRIFGKNYLKRGAK